jgi:hypothetical protein
VAKSSKALDAVVAANTRVHEGKKNKKKKKRKRERREKNEKQGRK